MSSRAKSLSADGWIAKQVANAGGDKAAALVAFKKKPNVNVVVQYCGDCGYAPKFEKLVGAIKKELGDGSTAWLNMSGRKDEGATGNFEVFVNNVLTHSKTEGGDGFVDTDAKLNVIVAAIRAQRDGSNGGLQSYGAVVPEGEEGGEDEEGMDEATERKTLLVSIATLVLSIPALIGACCWPALVVGLVSGTVSGFARSLGHYISFGITSLLMIIVNVFIARGIKYRWGSCCHRYGPFILSAIAGPLVCADLLRHVLNDTNVWPWCGDPSMQGGLYPRVNESWTSDCLWSSTQFICSIPCCVPGNNSAPPGYVGLEKDGMLPPYWPTKEHPEPYYQLKQAELDYINEQTIAGGTKGMPECNCLNCVPLEDENMWHLSPIGILFTIVFTYSGFTLLAISTMWNANIVKKCSEVKDQWKRLRGPGQRKGGAKSNARSKSGTINAPLLNDQV